MIVIYVNKKYFNLDKIVLWSIVKIKRLKTEKKN